jgi:hypothetical protein
VGSIESNRTAGAFPSDADYRAALPDLEAALEWSRMQSLPARSIVWGSSYSAVLVFLLAAKCPSEVAAVMAFSSGGYLGDTHTVKDAAATVCAPVFTTCARNAEEIAAARVPGGAVPGSSAVLFAPKRGVHGFFDTQMGQECLRRQQLASGRNVPRRAVAFEAGAVTPDNSATKRKSLDNWFLPPDLSVSVERRSLPGLTPRCKGMAELPEEAKSAGDHSPAGVGIRGLDRCHPQN